MQKDALLQVLRKNMTKFVELFVRYSKQLRVYKEPAKSYKRPELLNTVFKVDISYENDEVVFNPPLEKFGELIPHILNEFLACFEVFLLYL